MRLSGVVRDARGLGPHDHLCWAYDAPIEFAARAREFLCEGLSRGQRVVLMTHRAEVTAQLRGVAIIANALRGGGARMIPVERGYVVAALDPVAQVEACARATDEDLADGYSGLRVAADATSRVRSPGAIDAFARYEHLVDRYMTGSPFSAMCAFDRAELGESVVAQLACMHPSVNGPAAQFRLYAGVGAGTTLAGNVDVASRELFTLALDRADPQPVRGRVVLDGPDLHFIDHHALMRLAEHARRRDASAVLRTPLRAAARIVEVLGIDGVRVEQAT